MDELERTSDPPSPVQSARSADPPIQSLSPLAVDTLLQSSRSALSTGCMSSAAKKNVMNYLEKLDVDTRLEHIDQVCIKLLT